jgi:DNA-directed RNA polymerase specialized sigma24 family protein
MDRRWKAYHAIAVHLGFTQDAEDLASMAYEAWLKNPHRAGRRKHLVIDAIRSNFGRNPMPMTDQDVEKIGQTPESLADLEKRLKPLSQVERCCYILRHMWGLLDKEIAYCFGLSVSRVDQIIRHAQKKVSVANSP